MPFIIATNKSLSGLEFSQSVSINLPEAIPGLNHNL